MNAIDKLRSLQAGELDKVLPDIYVGTPWSKTLYPICKINAAKVEVTKVVLPDALKDIEDYFKPIDMSGSPVGGGNWVGKIMDERKEKLDVALTLLQQLKESL